MTETTRTEVRTEKQTALRRHRAGAFDIRNFIASLIGLYGVVLVLMGLFGTSEADLERAGGLNINLWAGLGMLVFAAAFVLWARLRPVVVPDDEIADQDEEAVRQPAEPSVARDAG